MKSADPGKRADGGSKGEMEFKAMLEGYKDPASEPGYRGIHYEDRDGMWREWRDLSAAGKLVYVARDAAICGVAVDQCVQATREVVSEQVLPEETYWDLLLSKERELRGLEELLPPDDSLRGEPLQERFQELLSERAKPELVIHDTIEGSLTLLEAFGDAFERLAITAEQKQLAEKFQEFVGEVNRPFSDMARHAYQKMFDEKAKELPDKPVSREKDRALDK